MPASTRQNLTRALGLQSDASDDDILTGVQALLDADDTPDGGSDNRTASRVASDPRREMADVVEQHVRQHKCTFSEALNQIKADPKHKSLSERVGKIYDPNYGR